MTLELTTSIGPGGFLRMPYRCRVDALAWLWSQGPESAADDAQVTPPVDVRERKALRTHGEKQAKRDRFAEWLAERKSTEGRG